MRSNALAGLHAAPPLRSEQLKVTDLTAFASGIAVALSRDSRDPWLVREPGKFPDDRQILFADGGFECSAHVTGEANSI